MTTTTTKSVTSFWFIGIIALIWNLMGVAAYLGQAFMTDEMRSTIPKDQLFLMENTPTWATAAFAIAVWGGVLASLLLLAKRKMAKTGFIISFMGIVIQLFYNFLMANSIEVYGLASLIIPIFTIIFGLFFIWYSKKCSDDGMLS